MSWLTLACVGLALTVWIVLAYRLRWRWTGFAEVRTPRSGDEDVQPAKTLWDWLQLLVIPLALAGLAFLLNQSQSDREQRREDERAARERIAATDAAREEALRGYLTQMSGLMLDRNLLRSKKGDDVRAVARTITLTTVRRVDGERRGAVVRFLQESRLLRSGDPKVAIYDANLRGANLAAAELINANLNGANLPKANLSSAILHDAHLGGTNLRGANLRNAGLFRADLFAAELQGADLRRADLLQADLVGAEYDSATRWPRGFDPAAAGLELAP
jgi:uncharacterized protein YjbI with pentapeptide repeats